MLPELTKLFELIKKHQLSVACQEPKRDGLLSVCFKTSRSSWNLYIEDEYGDFDLSNQPLCIFLTLRALEDYQETNDFLDWTNYYYLNASDGFWLQYYRDLAGTYAQIEKELGKINPFISGMDYELRSGAFDALVRSIE